MVLHTVTLGITLKLIVRCDHFNMLALCVYVYIYNIHANEKLVYTISSYTTSYTTLMVVEEIPLCKVI